MKAGKESTKRPTVHYFKLDLNTHGLWEKYFFSHKLQQKSELASIFKNVITEKDINILVHYML